MTEDVDDGIIGFEIEIGVDGPTKPVLGPRRQKIGATAPVPGIARRVDGVAAAHQGLRYEAELTRMAGETMEEEDGLPGLGAIHAEGKTAGKDGGLPRRRENA
jgi:hypothetical protein